MIGSVVLAVAALVAPAASGDSRLVAHCDYEAPWEIRPVAGRTFGTLWSRGSIDHGYSLDELECYREGISYCPLERRPETGLFRRPHTFRTGGVGGNFAERNPNYRADRAYRIEDFVVPGSDVARALEEDRPFMVEIREFRPAYYHPAEASRPDRADYLAWKRAHPKLIGVETLDEVDSDMTYLRMYYNSIADEEVREDFHRRYPMTVAEGRAFAWLKQAHRETVAACFGETNVWPMCSSYASACHMFGAVGVPGFFYESTSQSAGPWVQAIAYARGAARQFSIPFVWYTASYYTAYTRDGRRCSGESRFFDPPVLDDAARAKARKYPHRGSSRSLIARQNALGWLGGATLLQVEHWGRLFTDDTNGVRGPSPEGYDFERLWKMSRTIDRGVPYTPLAVLVPISEALPTDGRAGNGVLEFRDQFSQQLVFRTLVPTGVADGDDARRHGEQGCLYNSPFACFWDVLVPDAGQEPSAFRKALSAYPCAVLVGTGFRDDMLDTGSLAAYVRDGGTLIVSSDQVARGWVPAEEGKGKVVVLPADELLSERLRGVHLTGEAFAKANDEVLSGAVRSERLKKLLLQVQDELMPVRVRGDVQWGVNRTKSGWLVWCFNNRGVIKYSDEPETFDMTKTAKVEIEFLPRFGGARTSFELRPGEYRVWPRQAR